MSFLEKPTSEGLKLNPSEPLHSPHDHCLNTIMLSFTNKFAIVFKEI